MIVQRYILEAVVSLMQRLLFSLLDGNPDNYHNYQRTYPISYNSAGDSSEPIVTNQLTTDYNNTTDGTVFALIGTGGESFYPLASQAPYVASQFGKFGFLNIDIRNGNPHTKLTGTFYDNKGDETLDQFTIEKEIKNVKQSILPEFSK
jgi:hypothetical protein